MGSGDKRMKVFETTRTVGGGYVRATAGDYPSFSAGSDAELRSWLQGQRLKDEQISRAISDLQRFRKTTIAVSR
jgi:hypothetical protein